MAGLLLVASPRVAAAERSQRPSVDATAAIVIDARSGERLFEEGSAERHPIASTTKLMTALVTLERAELDDVFTAPAYRAEAAESKIDLRRGERMRVRDLLTALLLESANDASVTLAEGIAGSRSAFVEQMNRRARELGLRDTHYANAIGLDDPDNYSSARDLAVLARHLMRDPRFARVVARPRAKLRSGRRARVVKNRNALVDRYPFVDGIKTGHTRKARDVLVGAASGRGAQVISVVLGEPSESARNEDTLELLRYGLDQFRRVPAVRRGRTLARADAEDIPDRRVRLVAARDVALTVRRGERPRLRIDAPSELSGPLPAGRRVGAATVIYGGKPVRTVALVTAQAVPAAGVLDVLRSNVSSEIVVLLLLAATIGLVAGIRLRNRRARGPRRSGRRASAAR